MASMNQSVKQQRPPALAAALQHWWKDWVDPTRSLVESWNNRAPLPAPWLHHTLQMKDWVALHRRISGLQPHQQTSGGWHLKQLRLYQPGDDCRRMAWSATARTGQPFVREEAEERCTPCWIGLDWSATMSLGQQRSKAEWATWWGTLMAWAHLTQARGTAPIGWLVWTGQQWVSIPPIHHTSGLMHQWHQLWALLNPHLDQWVYPEQPTPAITTSPSTSQFKAFSSLPARLLHLSQRFGLDSSGVFWWITDARCLDNHPALFSLLPELSRKYQLTTWLINDPSDQQLPNRPMGGHLSSPASDHDVISLPYFSPELAIAYESAYQQHLATTVQKLAGYSKVHTVSTEQLQHVIQEINTPDTSKPSLEPFKV